jgi:hypothetical protein
MEADIQEKHLDVLKVTNEGVKNGTKEKQFHVIAKSHFILSRCWCFR